MIISTICEHTSENNCQDESHANLDSLKKQNCKCKDCGKRTWKI